MEQRMEQRMERGIEQGVERGIGHCSERSMGQVNERDRGNGELREREEHEALLALGFPSPPPEGRRRHESGFGARTASGDRGDGERRQAGPLRRGRRRVSLGGLRTLRTLRTLRSLRAFRALRNLRALRALRRLMRGRALEKLAADERGAVTAEYALVIMAIVYALKHTQI